MKKDKKDLTQYKNLKIIEKPAPETEDKPRRSMLMVYWEIESLYNTDYNLTIEEIMDILKCSRSWIEKIICKEVKYLYISQNTYQALYKVCCINKLDREFIKEIGKAKYFFSRKDFYKWLLKNTVAERQTIVIDLREYAEELEEFDRVLKEVRTSNTLEKPRKINKLYETLNTVGKKLINEKVYSNKRNLTKSRKLKLKSVDDIPKVFISVKELKMIYKNNESAYRYLFKAGYIKYTIYNSIVRFDADHEVNGGEYPETIDYNIYSSLIEHKRV